MRRTLSGIAREFPQLRFPIVQAPMAGGPSTPELAAAVADAGGLGFLAAGYTSADDLRAAIRATRELTSAPVGVNLFLVSETPVDAAALAAYGQEIEPDARRRGAAVGEARFDDDALGGKLEVVCAERPPVVSFTFGCPTSPTVERLHDHGLAVWVTVTEPAEAVAAAEVGADALVAQGVEAGGHRGSFEDLDGRGELSLLPLLRLIAGQVPLPLVASGGIADGVGVAAALVAGARAAQIGTAFMLCPEAGTGPAQREALSRPTPTALTRAFTGRRARGILNRFMRDHGPSAVSAYPHVHHQTAPLRAAARAAGDAEAINLWAGEAHVLAQARPAGELVRAWGAEMLAAVERARTTLERTALP
jgi:nitronate monooxygenase